MSTEPEQEARLLLTAAAVRSRAHQVLDAGIAGELTHFQVHPERIDAAADLVIEVTRDAYPDLDMPFHARWRHFATGGIDRWGAVAHAADWPDKAARARAEFDLAMISVLLDAGAGPAWTYPDRVTGRSFGRSEGLALASLSMFADGLFSSRPTEPRRADAEALRGLDTDRLARGFHAGPGNALLGLEGRAALLRALGEAVARRQDMFASADDPRPGGLYDHLARLARRGALPAPVILETILDAFGTIWPGRLSLAGVPLGDTWRHPAARGPGATDGLIPFHKLSQWLAYSLIEPLQAAGIRVTGIDGLTGLAEYRNGGLMLDSGILSLRAPGAAARPHEPGSELIVEWRALTVALLDRVADTMREKLGLDAESLPLAKVLEGGTWAAGRRLAREMRADAGPPLKVVSDGTLF